MIDFLIKRFEDNRDRDAFVWQNRAYSYNWLLGQISYWQTAILARGVEPGAISVLEADFSPNSIALFLALAQHNCVIVPVTSLVEAKKKEFIEIAQGEWRFTLAPDDRAEVSRIGKTATHGLYKKLRELGHPGLVLFSSGSTGKSKAAVHDLSRLLGKFRVPRQTLRTITFLLFDHIGGVNTMLHTLSNTGCLVTVLDRSPDGVFKAIEQFKVELLPTSPTFLNLVILSEANRRYDLSSLKIITYGTEPMPEATLKRIHEIFPSLRLQQTYGLSELGILRSKSKDSESLWVKIGGEGYGTKVVDGMLWIRADSAMLGYLNAPNPFDDEGWFNTEDAVEVDGDYLRILGRASEMINIGGEKVYPIEVESIIQTIEGVEDVTVKGEANPIMGKIVVAEVKLSTNETAQEFKRRMYAYCKDRLPHFKIPQKIALISAASHGERYKKIRRG